MKISKRKESRHIIINNNMMMIRKKTNKHFRVTTQLIIITIIKQPKIPMVIKLYSLENIMTEFHPTKISKILMKITIKRSIHNTYQLVDLS